MKSYLFNKPHVTDSMLLVQLSYVDTSNREQDRRFYWRVSGTIANDPEAIEDAFSVLLFNLGIDRRKVTERSFVPVKADLPDTFQQVMLGL